MRPKATTAQRRKAIQKKNRTHWLSHKHLILSQRVEKQTNNLTQQFDLDTFEPGISEISNEPMDLSIEDTAIETSPKTARNDEYLSNDWEEFVSPDENSDSSSMDYLEDEQSIDDDLIDEESLVAEEEAIDSFQAILDQRSIDQLVVNLHPREKLFLADRNA